MFTAGINVEKIENELIIRWQFAEIKIPLHEITDVAEDDTYGGKETNAIRIGHPYASTDRILIKTRSQSYLLFTSNKSKIVKVINS
jgi:hypothetical protein